MKFRGKVYVAGPYSRGDVILNIRAAIMAAEELVKLGFAPMVPHLNYAWHAIAPHIPEFWYSLDNEFLPDCDVLLRLPGESTGADAEVELARHRGMPVFYAIEDLDAYYRDHERIVPGD